MSTPARSRDQLRALTSLRFFAAMIVVCFHCGMQAGYPRWTGDFFRNGYEAVSFFFVLSGFILTYVYAPALAAPVSPGKFWAARIARICPVYYLALIIDLPRVIYSALVVHTISMPKFILALVSAPIFLQSWFPTIESVWNAPGWSLSVEAFFYLLFPSLTAWLNTIKRAHIVIGALLATVVVGVGRLLVPSISDTSEALAISARMMHFFPLMHLPQFVLGIAAARLFCDLPGIKARTAELLFIASISTVCLLFWSRSLLPALMLSDVILGPLYAVIIFSAAQAVGPVTGVLSRKLLVGLGEISYGVYILHGPLFFLWTRTCQHFLHESPITVWLFLPPLIVFCSLSYLLLEKPFRLRVRRLLVQRDLKHELPLPSTGRGI